MPEDLRRQYQNYTCADMTKFRAGAGLLTDQPTCEYTIEASIIDYVQNYLLRDERW
jgi:ADP-L-glycero-D-manno-heptose 6-epimerase